MSFISVLSVAVVLAVVHASDEWVENKIPLVKPTALLDQGLSRIVPGAKRGSLAEKAATKDLIVSLNLIDDEADVSEDDCGLKLVFTVTNPSKKSVKMCGRDTPLEGAPGKILSNLFVVQNAAGMVMRYRGKDVKRTEAPAESEMITIKGGKSKSQTICLRSYELAGDGLYFIRVKQPMDDHIIYNNVMSTQVRVMITGTEAFEQRHQERTAAREAENEKILAQTSVGAVSYNGCTSSESATLAEWHQDALHKIEAARACTKSSCSSQVDTWFGASTTQSQFAAGATAQFNTMANVEGNTIYRCESGNSAMSQVCGGSTFAYVYPTDTSQNVYMCDFTFNYPDYSEKVQTVIHELSHFNHVGDTNDNAYGESTCINLAQSNFQAAIQTADNVGYFGKYANQCYQNAPSGYVPKNSPLLGCVDQYSNCQSIAASGCNSAEQGYCCQSCTGGAASNDCSGVSTGGGSSSGGGSSFSDSRRRAPAPTPPTSGGTDTAGNCASLISNYGCSACCITGSGGTVASVCAASCRGGSAPTPTGAPTSAAVTRRRRYTPTADAPTSAAVTRRRRYTPTASSGSDSCQYSGDGECDEPTYCTTGTDTTDCGR